MDNEPQTQSDHVQIRIECENKREFCLIHLTKLTMESFLCDVSTHSVVRTLKPTEIKIFDHEETLVTKEFLKSTILKYEKVGNFRLRIEPTKKDGADLLEGHVVELVKELRANLTKNGMGHLIKMGKTGETVSQEDQRRVVREVSSVMSEKYGMNPIKVQYDGFTKAVCHIFPQWDSSKITKSIYTRFRNLRARDPKKKNEQAVKAKDANHGENGAESYEDASEFQTEYLSDESQATYVDKNEVEDEDVMDLTVFGTP